MVFEAMIEQGQMGEIINHKDGRSYKSAFTSQSRQIGKIERCGKGLTEYHAKLRCAISTLSNVNLRHFALPSPGSIFRPEHSSNFSTYSSSSTSSVGSKTPVFRNAHL